MPYVAVRYMTFRGKEVAPGDPLEGSVNKALIPLYVKWSNETPTQAPPPVKEEAGLELAEASAPLLIPEPEALPPVPVPMQDEPKRSKARRKKPKRKTGR